MMNATLQNVPIVIYGGYAARYLPAPEQHRQKGNENKVLRRMFEPKKDEETG
jgi:hypothetical protein